MAGVGRIFDIVRPHWQRVALAVVLSGGVSALNGALAWIVKPVVDKVFIEGNPGFLMLAAGGVGLAFLFKGVLTFAQNYLMDSVGAKIVRDVRNDLYSHMAYLPMSHYGTDSAGAMMSRIINDAAMFKNLLAFKVKDLFLSVGTIAVLTGVAMYRRLDLTLMALVVLPFAFIFVGRIGKRLKMVSKAAQQKIATITESLSEGLTGIKVIKAFCTEKQELQRFGRRNQDFYREVMRATRLTESTSLLMEFVAGIGGGFIIYYGGLLVGTGEITTGDFFSFMAAILMIYSPAKKLAQVQNGFQQARAYIERIDHIFDLKKEPDGTVELPPISRDIEFRDVYFRYQGRVEDALSGVSLMIDKGEIVALVGRSGSGKTTLADLTAKFYMPQKGSIRIDGVDINTVTLSSLRSQIGIVSQDVILFNDSVRNNIAYGRTEVDDREVQEAARAAYAHEFIMELPQGYDTPIGPRGVMLSGGQRQRLSIARAMIKNPPILILDEATSALDTQSEMMVQKAIDNIIEVSSESGSSSGKTIIIIAHRLSTIKRADRIVVLDRGRIIETGPHDELLRANGLYRKLYDLQHGDSDYFDTDEIPV